MNRTQGRKTYHGNKSRKNNNQKSNSERGGPVSGRGRGGPIRSSPRIEPFSAGNRYYVPPGNGPSGSGLFLKGVPSAMTVDMLRRIFGRYGKILQINIPLDNETRRPRGIAFVNYNNSESAQKALQDIGNEMQFEKYKTYVEKNYYEDDDDENNLEEIDMDDNTIHVKNIPDGKTKEEVEEMFRIYGQVKKTIYNQRNNSAFITYVNYKSVDIAYNQNRMPVMKIQINRRN
jgi:RNA recognition motif-containing protein